MSNKLAIVNGTVVTETCLIPDSNILVESGKILKITQSVSPSSFVQIDAEGGYISPGFIDLHIHGFGGYDVTQGDEDSLVGVSRALLRHGTTSFLPTLVSLPNPQIRLFLKSVVNCIPCRSGARILGANLEGPFLNPMKRGVHREEYLMQPSSDSLKEMTQGYEGILRILTFSPELNGGLELCRMAVEKGIIPAIGHTNASYEQANQGIKAGITHCTHLFNGMPSIQSREGGAVAAVLLSDIVKAEIIADGKHLSAEVTQLATRIKRPDGLILVSDAVMPTDTDITEFELAGTRAYIKDGNSFTEEGKLCGSTLTLERAVRNIMTWNGLSLPEAIRMASLNPAKQLGIASTTGSLVEGKDADIVILNKELEVLCTLIKGAQVYP